MQLGSRDDEFSKLQEYAKKILPTSKDRATTKKKLQTLLDEKNKVRYFIPAISCIYSCI